jgi:uncharacterized protein YecT (DUF1311 family)
VRWHLFGQLGKWRLRVGSSLSRQAVIFPARQPAKLTRTAEFGQKRSFPFPNRIDMKALMKFFVSLFVFGLAGTANADTECALISNASIESCVAENFKQADRELNVVYRQTIDQVVSSYKAEPELRTELLSKLKSAQTAWIKFRDANCAVFAFEIEESKPAYTMALNQCKTRMTKDRTGQLLNGFPNV